MNFMDAVKTCFSKYTDFSGRAARSEYWWFVLFTILVGGGLEFLALSGQGNALTIIAGLGYFIFFFGTLIPYLAVAVRRLHDLDMSGWFLLLGIIPLVNLVLIYWFCCKGTAGANRFGS